MTVVSVTVSLLLVLGPKSLCERLLSFGPIPFSSVGTWCWPRLKPSGTHKNQIELHGPIPFSSVGTWCWPRLKPSGTHKNQIELHNASVCCSTELMPSSLITSAAGKLSCALHNEAVWKALILEKSCSQPAKQRRQKPLKMASQRWSMYACMYLCMDACTHVQYVLIM